MKGLVAGIGLLIALAGCAERRQVLSPAVRRATLPHLPETPVDVQPTANYHIACPDVLHIVIPAKPELECIASVDLDGRVNLSEADRPRVEGQTAEDAAERIAVALGLQSNAVFVRVMEPRTARVVLRGPELNRRKFIAYRGPERVADFLVRTGALQPGQADLHEVCVIRPNVAIGGRPEFFQVDFYAISQGDPTTNILLRPCDEVIVGEMRRSSFARLLPKWMVPTYQRIMAWIPPGWPWVR